MRRSVAANGDHEQVHARVIGRYLLPHANSWATAYTLTFRRLGRLNIRQPQQSNRQTPEPILFLDAGSVQLMYYHRKTCAVPDAVRVRLQPAELRHLHGAVLRADQ
jgi:hypothetical protein